MVRALALAVAVAAAGVTLSFAQGAQQGSFVEHVDVTVGNVDVVVVDHAGRPVRGLSRDDFALLLDGQPAEITNFAAFGEASGEESPGRLPRGWAEETPQAPERVLAIFVDNENTSVFNRNHALKRLEAFVRETVVPPSRGVVVTNEGALRFACSLTSDAEELVATIERLLRTSSGIGAVQTFRKQGEEQIRAIAEERSVRPEIRVDRAMTTARVNASQLETSLRRTIATFKELVHMLAGVGGRKSLLYVSDGIPMSPGLEMFYLINELLPARPGEAELGRYDASGLLSELVSYADAADVALYTIDARGVYLASGQEAERRVAESSEVATIHTRNYQDPLVFLASQTGGVAVVNTNDVEKGMRGIRESMQNFYSLGFALPGPPRDAMHAVKVGLRGRSGLRLRYRPTFVQRTVSGRVADRTVAGLGFELEDNPLGVSVEAGTPRSAGEDAFEVPLTIRVPLERLALVPQGDAMSGAISLFFAARDAEGHNAPLTHTHQVVSIPAAQAQHVRTFAVSTSVQVGRGSTTVSVGLLDETSGTAGFATATVQTP